MKTLAKTLKVIVLLTTSIGCGTKPHMPKKEPSLDTLPTERVESEEKIVRPEMTFQIRHPRNQGNAVQVRLDIDALRLHGLSKEDAMSAVRPGGIVDSEDPPPGVVFSEYVKREQLENIILKANPEGEVVRLTDVAKLELLTAPEIQKLETERGGN